MPSALGARAKTYLLRCVRNRERKLCLYCDRAAAAIELCARRRHVRIIFVSLADSLSRAHEVWESQVDGVVASGVFMARGSFSGVSLNLTRAAQRPVKRCEMDPADKGLQLSPQGIIWGLA